MLSLESVHHFPIEIAQSRFGQICRCEALQGAERRSNPNDLTKKSQAPF